MGKVPTIGLPTSADIRGPPRPFGARITHTAPEHFGNSEIGKKVPPRLKNLFRCAAKCKCSTPHRSGVVGRVKTQLNQHFSKVQAGSTAGTVRSMPVIDPRAISTDIAGRTSRPAW